eukprot:SAG22_NODE_6064_length_906_cov_0.899752_2_plen_135_part_00
MLELENGVGVLGDASYLAPESMGQSATPLYWRFAFHGTGGVLVCQTSPAECEVYSNAQSEKRVIKADGKSVDSLEGLTGQSYLDSMLAEIGGADPASLPLSTKEVLMTMRSTLWAQAAADQKLTGVDIPWAAGH